MNERLPCPGRCQGSSAFMLNATLQLTKNKIG